MGRVSRAVGSLTRADFKRVARRFPRLSEHAKTVAEGVLVDGLLQVEAAEQFGVSRSLVNRWVKQLYDAYLGDLECPQGWVIATIMLPPEEMRAVQEMERDLRARLLRKIRVDRKGKR